MQINKKIHRQIRLQNISFVALLLVIVGLLGWLSTRYHFEADWTANNRNSLSDASIAILKGIEGPVTFKAFAREIETLRAPISKVIGLYQRHKADIQLEFINPDTSPDLVRQYNIATEGELVISYGGRSENLRELTEQELSNTLQRLARSQERWLVFLSGHGERNSEGAANHDLSNWAAQLKNRGFKIQPLNLGVTLQIPDNTSALIISSAQVDWLPGEVELIKGYLEQGGNLLWLADPDPLRGLEPIAKQLGIQFSKGVIVEPATQMLGISDPRFALAASYSSHAITQGFEVLTLFPMATGITTSAHDNWVAQPLLTSMERSWVETKPIDGKISYDAGSDTLGPVNIAVTLTRQLAGSEQKNPSAAREQRAVIVGDGDFLSNAYLGNGGNLDLGLNMINWLSHDDQFVAIPAKGALDRNLALSATAQVMLVAGLLVLIPGGLLVAGLVIWLKRRKG